MDHPAVPATSDATFADDVLTYQVMGMPTLIRFRGGAAVARIVGARPDAALLRELDPLAG